MRNKILITSALPYANGSVHLGQIAGCYLPADIYYRYQKLKKRDVIHICGTDENGVPITIEAEKAGKSPKELVDFYYKNIRETLGRLGIVHDNFSRTSTPLHHTNAQNFFKKVYENNYIITKKVKQYYCLECERFLPDRYIEGKCPNCGSDEARGDQCENCGRWLVPEELIHPRCKICGGKPELRETEHWFFRLDLLQSKLEKWIETKVHWKNNVKRFCRGWFNEGLRPRAITRDLKWGIPVPLKEAAEKVLYVWFDAPIGYISSTMEWACGIGDPDRWKEYWLDNTTELIHFIGKDNIVFHAIVWPAMLIAHSDYILPSEIPANEFLNLKGAKFSTSRRRAIWLHEALDTFEPDLLRYALSINLPENKDTDFDWDDFDQYLASEAIWIQMWVQLDSPDQKGAYMSFLNSYTDSQRELGRMQRPNNNKLLNVMEWLDDREVVPEEATSLMIISLLFLVVCALNLIGILLGKFLTRAPEVSVRRALGASRLSVFVQHIIECETIGIFGGFLGILVAVLGLRAVNSLFAR